MVEQLDSEVLRGEDLLRTKKEAKQVLARSRGTLTQDDAGFTLIELLVVIIIIGILAAIAVPVFLSQRKKGYEASEKSDLRSIANEMETFFTDNQSYPTSSGTATFAANNPADGSSSGSVVIGPTATATTVRMSKGNAVALAQIGTGAKGYCLSMANSNTGSSTANWFYDSLTGGLNNTGCSAAASYS